jgi:hypothetical protein
MLHPLVSGLPSKGGPLNRRQPAESVALSSVLSPAPKYGSTDSEVRDRLGRHRMRARPLSAADGYPSRTSHPKDTPSKSERERMDMVAPYNHVGSYRAAATICDVDLKTVTRAVPSQRKGRPPRAAAGATTT